MRKLKSGLYEHYKGGKYLVIGKAKHSETMEDLAIYIRLHQRDDSEQYLWARPMKMFLGMKEVDGKQVERFKYLGEQQLEA